MTYRSLSPRLVACWFALATVVGCADDSEEDRNIVVNSRIVLLDPAAAKRAIEKWSLRFSITESFVPDAAEAKAVDAMINDYLATVADDPASVEGDDWALPNWKSGILNVRDHLPEYWVQFGGVKTADGKRLLVGFYMYSKAQPDLSWERFSQLDYDPWLSDGDGSNFMVVFDNVTKQFVYFHVEGSDAGPFGIEGASLSLPDYTSE